MTATITNPGVYVTLAMLAALALWAGAVQVRHVLHRRGGRGHPSNLDAAISAVVRADAEARALTVTSRARPPTVEATSRARANLLHAAHELARAAGGPS